MPRGCLHRVAGVCLGGVCPGEFLPGGYLPGGVSGRHPLDRMTDTCKNIILPQLRCGW